MIAHADRLWASAVQNATRIGSRVQIVGGGVLVVIGVDISLLFAFDKMPDFPGAGYWFGVLLNVAMRLVIVSSLFYFAIAIARLYIRNEESRDAARLMEFKNSDAGKAVKMLVFHKIHDAYLELSRLNEEEKKRLQSAQSAFARGLALLGAAAIIFVVWGAIPKFLSDGDVNVDRQRKTATTSVSDRPGNSRSGR